MTVFHEITDQPIFPHLPEGMKNYSGFRVSRQHGVYPEGFSLSRFGLKFILTNPLYIGYWFNPASGEWVPGNHPAIVPFEHFWYAFHRLSPVLLDGSPNPECLHATTGRNTSNLDEIDGLFHGLFVTDNEQWRVSRRVLNNKGKKELYYQLYNYNFGNKPIHLLHIRADEFDTALLPVLVRKLKDTEELEGFRRYGENLQAIVATRTANLQRLLAENEAEQKATEMRIDTLTDPQLILRQEEKYKGLRARHAVLEQQLADDSQPAQRRRRILTYYELIELLGPRLEKMEPADRRIIVESTIDSIFIRDLSPSFLFLRINWLAWQEQTFLYRRDNVAAGTWDDDEVATLKRLWATASPGELLLALPERTWSAIRGERKGLKLAGRWTRWEPCILPEWAEHGYAAADVTILDQYELQLGDPKLVEISSTSSVDEIPSPLHPYI